MPSPSPPRQTYESRGSHRTRPAEDCGPSYGLPPPLLAGHRPRSSVVPPISRRGSLYISLVLFAACKFGGVVDEPRASRRRRAQRRDLDDGHLRHARKHKGTGRTAARRAPNEEVDGAKRRPWRVKDARTARNGPGNSRNGAKHEACRPASDHRFQWSLRRFLSHGRRCGALFRSAKGKNWHRFRSCSNPTIVWCGG